MFIACNRIDVLDIVVVLHGRLECHGQELREIEAQENIPVDVDISEAFVISGKEVDIALQSNLVLEELIRDICLEGRTQFVTQFGVDIQTISA